MADILPFLPIALEIGTDGQPPDADARQQALDIRQSFIVEAPAGSGKTGLLIQRFLKLLADPSVTAPEQVLAITFTTKATAEMRDRVLAQLEAGHRNASAPSASDFDRETIQLAQAVLDRDRQLEWSLLDHPDRLNIRTIDSLCAEIARSLPVLSESGGRLSPSSDAESLHREAARRTLLLFGDGDAAFDAALRDLLLHRDGNLGDCESLLTEMLSLRDQWGELIWGELLSIDQRPNLDNAYLDANVLPRLQRTLEHAICAELAQLEQAFPPDILAKLTSLTAILGYAAAYNGNPSPIAHCAGNHTPPTGLAQHLEHWKALIHMLTITGGSWRKERGINGKNLGFVYDRKEEYHPRLTGIIDALSHREDLQLAFENVRALPPACYPAAQWRVAKSLFRVLSRALVELQFVFAERNQCDFTELSLLARHALSQESGANDLAEALGARLQHLLVDEMQDTSTAQYELLQLLTASWDGHSQTVFLVGDPRQSIYLFRQARVERFIQAMLTQRLGDLPLTRLRLTANFRSQEHLVHRFNDDFARIFPASSAPESLPYSDAISILPPSPFASARQWHTELLPYVPRSNSTATPPPDAATSAQQNQEQRRRQAKEILHVAAHWFATPLPEDRRTIRDQAGNQIPEPWRMAVLVRNRNHLVEIVAALRQQDPASAIRFRATEIEALNERQEVLDLTALTRALLHPADRVAGFAVLHAPWCGLTLAELHTIARGDEAQFKDRSVQRLIEQHEHLLPDQSRQRVARVLGVLRAAAEQRAGLTTAQLVERAWRSLGGDAWLEPAQLSNAQRFFQLLDQIEDGAGGPGRLDTSLLESRLQRLYAEPDDVPQGVPFVDLLTIHKAKGLEWDVVLVPSLERGPGRTPARLLSWSLIESPGTTETHVMLAPIAAKGETVDPLTTWLNRMHRAREAAERKRLFYVACTRARQELHLFAAPTAKSSGEAGVSPASLLDAAWPAAEPHFGVEREAIAVLELAASLADAEEDEPSSNLLPFSSFIEIGNASLQMSGRGRRPALETLPANFDPASRFHLARTRTLPYGDADATPAGNQALFARPEGSFSARSFGNVVHAWLEILSRRIAHGETPTRLLAELPTWTPRIAALLRSDGLARETVEHLTRETRTALDRVLRDPDGLWLLEPHPDAASEFALSAWSSDGQQPASVRADRIYHAGSEPHASGEDSLWIIDYKTASHGPQGLQDFLQAQRGAYGPQLETYARILAPARSKSLPHVRLALYFPTIPRLVWWKLESPRTAR